MSDELENLLSQLIGLDDDDDLDGMDTPITEELAELDDFSGEMPILPLRGLVVYPHTAIPLTVGQSRSIKLVDDVAAGNRLVTLVTSLDPEQETPGPEDVYQVGTLAVIHRLFRASDGTIRLLVRGIRAVDIENYTETLPYLKAKITPIPEPTVDEEAVEIEALVRNVENLFKQLADLMPSIPSELVQSALNVDSALQLVYSIATYVRIDLDDAQQLLELGSVEEKLQSLLKLLSKEVEVLEIGRKIQHEAQSEMEKTQREYYLREQMRAIQRELAEGDDQSAEISEFRKKIDEAGMTEEAKEEADRELNRLSKLPLASAEYGVIRTYLDWLVSMPWQKRTEDNLDISHAREVLDEDHYGLKDIKERILEFLAVRKLREERSEEFEKDEVRDYVRRDRTGAILCFVGPPGVGKTSLGASIARAMERKFIRMSLGGVRDEAEIRGFRRTYIGAMPGRIVQTIRRSESNNPLIMLDEIDKLGRDFRGDPSSALLEVLDPEQNSEFRDHYLDIAYDLSNVLFITTANSLDTIPGPLRDRMEIIQLSGYTEQEKLAIAKQYLVPRQIRENGLRAEEIEFNDDAIKVVIEDYTREAGVRNLEREIGRTARKVVTKIASGEKDKVDIDADKIRELLGNPRYGHRTELRRPNRLTGCCNGLSVDSRGW